MSETVGVPTEDNEERDKLVRKAYAEATKELRSAHHDEFVKLQKKHAESLGVDWSPRLTEEQRARQTYEELVAKYPHFSE
jgi:hypothetical protein